MFFHDSSSLPVLLNPVANSKALLNSPVLIPSYIIPATFLTDLWVVSIFTESVASHQREDSRHSAIFSFSLAANSSLSLKAFSSHVKVNFCSTKSEFRTIEKSIQEIGYITFHHSLCLFHYNPWMRHPHQSPSSQTLLSSRCCSSLQTDVFPTPGAPFTMISFFFSELNFPVLRRSQSLNTVVLVSSVTNGWSVFRQS